MRILFVVAAVLLLVPGWSGEEHVRRLGRTALVTATPVVLDPGDPSRRNVGALTFLGGIALTSPDPAFGGFSALAVDGRRFTLLSDAGNVVRFTLGTDWRPRAVSFSSLPAGPRTGWEKRDRDSESLVTDGRSTWIGFESIGAIWRYDAALTRAERRVRPKPMRHWQSNGGPESLVRLHDGRFVALGEDPPRHAQWQQGLVFAGDPTSHRRPAVTFRFAPPPGYDPSDACELPDGRLLILVRRFSLPYRFANQLLLVDPATIRPGALVRGRSIATLAAPLIHDNFEGVAAAVENGATILWLVSDDNQSMLQRSLLLKFRLD